MDKDKRPLNDFVHCSCGVAYISGYTHCPKCGKKNEAINKIISDKKTRSRGNTLG